MVETIEIVEKEKCMGCKMCGDACPTEAISFYDEKDGFWYPRINHDKCVKCGRCYQKCPSINNMINQNDSVLKCYGAKTLNEEIRYESTSGGFFSELASKWIEDGGIVIGAAYNSNHLVYHKFIVESKDIKELRQSKYVQSDTKGIYIKTKEFLEGNKKVLFCGTPCQVEALQLFLGKKYDSLLTIDFVCCGICSPGIYKKYLRELEQEYKSPIKRIWFKNKAEGWRNIGVRVDFDNGKHYFRNGTRDLYMIAFVIDALSMRSSCEKCKYRKLPHNSDIMLGDFWGIEKVNASFDDNMGVSAVLLNSKNGEDAFESIKDRLEFFETTKDEISKGNFTIHKAKSFNVMRNEFMNMVNLKGFKKAMANYSSYKGLNKVLLNIKYYKNKIKSKIAGRN